MLVGYKANPNIKEYYDAGEKTPLMQAVIKNINIKNYLWTKALCKKQA